jgi:hypothetical protein
VSRRLKGEQPTVDLMIGYRKDNSSPTLKTFLSRIGATIWRQMTRVLDLPRHALVMRLD